MDASGEGDSAAPVDARDVTIARPPTGELIRTHRTQITIAALLLAAAAVIGVDDRPLMVTLVALAPIAGAVAVIDAHAFRIPTELTIAAAVIAAVILAGGAAASTGSWAGYARALTAALALWVFYLALWRWAGMGLGDVRLAAALGVLAGWSGWPTVVVFVVLAHGLMLPLAVWRLALNGRADLPFGPALVIGAYLAAVLVGFTGRPGLARTPGG